MVFLKLQKRLAASVLRCGQRTVCLGVLGQSPGFPQSSSAPPHSALQGFTSDFTAAYSTAASKFVEASDVYEYNKLISTLNYKKRPNLMRDVYEDMLLDGVKPIHETFFRLIDGCMKGSRLQDVMYFFEEMKAMGLSPDVASYNSVIAACGRSMQVDRAFQVAEEMEASGIQLRQRTFLALLRTCAIAGRVDEAYEVVTKMTASGLSLDKNFYSALIIAHRNKKPQSEETIQKIFELLEQSKHRRSSEDLMAVAATGEFETTDGIDDGLANMLSDDMQHKRGFINHRLTVYRAAVKSLSALGNKEAVKTVLKLVEMDGHDLDSYCVIQLIKEVMLGSGLPRLSLRWDKKLLAKACSEYSKYMDTGRQPTVELYVVLIEGAIHNSSPESSTIAQKLLADLVQKGYFLNAHLGLRLLQQVCQTKSRDIAVANMVWDIMRDREVKISKFIAQEYLRALERSDIPGDDPRLIGVKAMVDGGHRVDFKGLADPTQTAPSHDVSKRMAPSEEGSGQTGALETPSDQIHSDSKSIVLVNESPIETKSGSETLDSSLEQVESSERE